MDTLEFIKNNCNCCATEKPLSTSKHINMVQLQFKAKWKYPVWGNFISRVSDMAIAYVHDDAIENGVIVAPVKFAIEIDGEKITYHPVPTCRVCGCTDDNCKQCIEKTGKPCSWVEEDLCSACANNK